MIQRRLAQLVTLSLGILLAWSFAPARAQLREIPRITSEVYAAMPDLPREDHYITSSGEDLDSTFLRRVLLYHMRAEGRSLYSRLDWKLTFADYLGINLTMYAQLYPGHDQFSENPYSGDIAAFQSLSAAQRDRLLAALLASVDFNGVENSLDVANIDPTLRSPLAPYETETSVATPAPTVELPGGGSADLLQSR